MKSLLAISLLAVTTMGCGAEPTVKVASAEPAPPLANKATPAPAPHSTTAHPRRKPATEVRALTATESAPEDVAFKRGTRRFSREGVGAGISITLKNEFIEQYKNRATIDTTYTIDAASKVHPAKDDGEIHIAGRAPEIELPTVAEIMQASSETTTIKKVRALAGSGNTSRVSGAWRIWCEHAGGGAQIQGTSLDPFDTSNPDHVFEIHPVTIFGTTKLFRTFMPIAGYQPKKAENAFMSYEQTPSHITTDGDSTTIVTRAVGNNFVEFLLRVEGSPYDVDDGRFVIASALDLNGDLVVRNRRMVFVKDTPPYAAFGNLKAGECLQVIGIPRVDLALVSWRTHHAQDNAGSLEWNLPYEIIVVAAKGRVACEE